MDTSPSLQQPESQMIELALRQAVAHQQAGQLEDAVRSYLSILQSQPNHPEANFNLGALAIQTHHFAAALPYFNAALDADPTRGQFWLAYIDALLQAGQLEDAQAVLTLAQQRGLQGGEVDALVRRLEGIAQRAEPPNAAYRQPIPDASPVSSASPQNNTQKPGGKFTRQGKTRGKPSPQPRKNPSVQQTNALVTLFSEGRYAEAEILARRMTEDFPLHAFGWTALGAVLKQLGRDFDALEAMRKAARLSPHDVEVQYNLGVTLQDVDQLELAEASYRTALQLDPDHAKTLYNLGNVLNKRGKPNEAEQNFRHALDIKPDFSEAHNNLANTLVDLGRIDEAAIHFRRALEIKPDNAPALYNLGNALVNLGQTHEAESLFKRTLEIKPDFIEARYKLAQIRKTETDDENLTELTALARDVSNGGPRPSDRDMTLLHFALGKCHSDLAHHEKAFVHILEGCKLKRATFDYDSALNSQNFASIARVFDCSTMNRLQGGDISSNLPIFVIGMPRSGTTLTEQIISSHPDAHGAGELPDFLSIVRQDIAGNTFPENVLLLDQPMLTSWGNGYIDRLNRIAPDARRITDKMPGNFLAVGLIHLMLPNAKIIHVRRNPIDTCMSCLTTLFKQGHAFTYDLAELGQYYVDYARLMEHWRTLLPSEAFLDVRYEDIVEDQETQSRRILEYCGLEWNDACLDFHKNPRAVSTASMTQVRQRIYTSSVDRWRAYEKFLGPLLDALGDFAPTR
jgi:tetratricopeptide (TPR) repeat protein